MIKTVIQRATIGLAAVAAGGAIAVLPSASLANSNSRACGNANSHTRNVRTLNTSCRTARYWAVRNRCPGGWSFTGSGTTAIGGSGGASSSPDRNTCKRGRQSFSWTHTSGGSGSGTGTITIG